MKILPFYISQQNQIIVYDTMNKVFLRLWMLVHILTQLFLLWQQLKC